MTLTAPAVSLGGDSKILVNPLKLRACKGFYFFAFYDLKSNYDQYLSRFNKVMEILKFRKEN